jgi:hypothetical protein
VLSLIGTVIYATALSVIGYELGHAWNSISHGLTIVGYALFALVVIAIVGFVLYRLRQFRREGREAREGHEGHEGHEGETPPRRPGRHRSDAEVG